MKKMFNEGNKIHNFMSSSGSGTVGSDFLTSYGSGSGSTSQKVTVPTVPVPVPVPQHWTIAHLSVAEIVNCGMKEKDLIPGCNAGQCWTVPLSLIGEGWQCK
jgi:hypothetical protein